jgi:hypothetical protein
MANCTLLSRVREDRFGDSSEAQRLTADRCLMARISKFSVSWRIGIGIRLQLWDASGVYWGMTLI